MVNSLKCKLKCYVRQCSFMTLLLYCVFSPGKQTKQYCSVNRATRLYYLILLIDDSHFCKWHWAKIAGLQECLNCAQSLHLPLLKNYIEISRTHSNQSAWLMKFFLKLLFSWHWLSKKLDAHFLLHLWLLGKRDLVINIYYLPIPVSLMVGLLLYSVPELRKMSAMSLIINKAVVCV